MSMSPQVIYKKFNIPCPLADDHHNKTAAEHYSVDSTADGFCDSKLFTMNPQVSEQTFSRCLCLVSCCVMCIFI